MVSKQQSRTLEWEKKRQTKEHEVSSVWCLPTETVKGWCYVYEAVMNNYSILIASICYFQWIMAGTYQPLLKWTFIICFKVHQLSEHQNLLLTVTDLGQTDVYYGNLQVSNACSSFIVLHLTWQDLYQLRISCYTYNWELEILQIDYCHNASQDSTSKWHAVCEQSWAQIDKIETKEDIDEIAKLWACIRIWHQWVRCAKSHFGQTLE